MDQVGRSLGISGDPQGFFLYLLIMVGIFVVISILIYNWLEERRFNKQVESNFSTIEEDALLDDKQQQFFDKFASTTGVLNDQPPEGTFIDENGEALEDDRSIEDVYAELLETMSKRNRQEKVEPEGVTIDHQQMNVASEPVLEIPVDDAGFTDAKEPKLYIPEPAEISDVEFTETTSTSAAEDNEVHLTFDEDVDQAVPVNVADLSDSSKSPSTPTGILNEPITQRVGISSETQTLEDSLATEENDIKAIINRAFKEKYNPNFKAEQDALKAENNPSPESTQQAGKVDEETVDEAQADEEDVNASISAPDAIDPIEEASTLEVAEGSQPVGAAPIETEEPPVLSFAVEELAEPVEVPSSTIQDTPSIDEEDDLGFLKGLDEDEMKPDLSFDDGKTSEPEPPILDEAVSKPEENGDSVGQAYQQLLNTDALENTDAPERLPHAAFSVHATQSNLNVPEEEGDHASDEASEQDENNTDQAKEKNEATSSNEEAHSHFTDALPAHLNQHIDFIGTIEASKGSNAAFILESFSTFHQQFEFPVFVFMQCEQSQWLLLNAVTEGEIAQYLTRSQPVHITASIQMADRTGPISRNTIQRFKQSLSEIAVTMGATAEWVDPTDPIDRAASLDAFCIEVDKTMFFHLANTKTPFTGTKLKGLVESQGMALEKDGAYKYYDLNTENGMKRSVPDFVLFNRDNHKFTEEMLRSSVIKAVTMQLDIPLVPTHAAALDRMVVIAQSLESSLNAQLVDDKNRPITDVHLARIRDQIKSIHAAMQLRGITPGSSHAQRLFS